MVDPINTRRKDKPSKVKIEYKNTNSPVRKILSKTKHEVRDLKCFYTNARSLRNKKDELFGYIIDENLDIICISESWINEEVLNESKLEYELDGYLLYTYQRPNRIGGGLALYVKNSLVSVQNDSFKISDDVESLWVDINFESVSNSKENSIRIGVFYRPPNQQTGIEYDKLMINEINSACNSNTLILGDFNLPTINWDTHEVNNEEGRLFMECCQDNFLTQFVEKPTRGKNILDLVLANQDSVKELQIGETLSNSDHNIIRFSLEGPNKFIKSNKAKIPDFKKGDYESFRKKLESINWNIEFKNKNGHQMWERFKSILSDIQNSCIPSRNIRDINRKPSWWNSKISKMIKLKKAAFKKFKQSNDRVDYLEDYKKNRDSLNSFIRKCKREAEINLACNSKKDPKKFFSFYKFNKKKGDRIGPIEINGSLINDDKEIANSLNNYFSSVFTKENLNNFDFETNNEQNHGRESLENIEISPETIKKLIKNIKPNKSAGPDEIYAKILKEGNNSLSVALSILFTRSMSHSEIPDDWKSANVVPIFKKGSRKELENYRPISLTSLVGKLLEKIVKDGIQEHLDQHKLILDSQHGFRTGKSCLTNLLEFLEYATSHVDKGEDIDVIYLDFSKAFDKVPHQRLLHKLKLHGISGYILSWIREWLKDRKQRVTLNGFKSEWQKVLSGVPQGSVLGPLLFIIYLNDLESKLGCKVFKFADDTKLVKTVNDLESSFELQKILDRLIAWAEKWQMEFNVKKCKVSHIGSTNGKFEYEMNGNFLKEVNEEKDLGIIISNDLKSSKQCLAACKKANQMLGMISRNVAYKNKKVIGKLVNSYVRPQLEYCVQAWSPHFRQDVLMIEKVLRRSTREIPSLRHLEYPDRLKSLGMYSYERRYLRGDMILVYNMFNGIVDLNIENFFEMETSNRTRGHNLKLKKKHCRLDVRKFFFSHRVVDFWNDLPSDVVNSNSLNIFKRKIDEYMNLLNLV